MSWKITTEYDNIFQLHLNNVATLPCKNFSCFWQIENETMWMFAFKFEVRTK